MDTFDLKKFLKENKSLENLNPTIKALNENEMPAKEKMTKEAMKKHIKDMIVAELAEETATDMMDPVYEGDKTKEEEDEEIEALASGGFANFGEAKKKDEEVEDVEVTDTEEEMPAEDVPAEEAPAADGGGLEDIAADMEGTEGELMDSLMKAFKIAKGMGNEKLETQVGNTLKFFVSEYIGGEEN